MKKQRLRWRTGGALLAALLGLSLELDGSEAATLSWPLRSGTDAPVPVRRVGYGGTVRAYIADLKTSFPEHKSYSAATALTDGNYRAVLDGLKSNVGVNGIRLPIMPSHPRAEDYAPLYKEIYAYARGLGLSIYASPMSVGMGSYAGWSDTDYAAWLADYANLFKPDVLSPFNEPGIGNARMTTIVTALRSRLSVSLLLCGPDRQHVNKSLEAFASRPSIDGLFDIVGSHNADRDATATTDNWSRLVGVGAGKPVWASEDPADWSQGHGPGLPGIDQAVAGGVAGIVIWMAKPGLVDETGQPTGKAREIAERLRRPQ